MSDWTEDEKSKNLGVDIPDIVLMMMGINPDVSPELFPINSLIDVGLKHPTTTDTSTQTPTSRRLSESNQTEFLLDIPQVHLQDRCSNDWAIALKN